MSDPTLGGRGGDSFLPDVVVDGRVLKSVAVDGWDPEALGLDGSLAEGELVGEGAGSTDVAEDRTSNFGYYSGSGSHFHSEAYRWGKHRWTVDCGWRQASRGPGAVDGTDCVNDPLGLCDGDGSWFQLRIVEDGGRNFHCPPLPRPLEVGDVAGGRGDRTSLGRGATEPGGTDSNLPGEVESDRLLWTLSTVPSFRRSSRLSRRKRRRCPKRNDRKRKYPAVHTSVGPRISNLPTGGNYYRSSSATFECPGRDPCPEQVPQR